MKNKSEIDPKKLGYAIYPEVPWKKTKWKNPKQSIIVKVAAVKEKNSKTPLAMVGGIYEKNI